MRQASNENTLSVDIGIQELKKAVDESMTNHWNAFKDDYVAHYEQFRKEYIEPSISFIDTQKKTADENYKKLESNYVALLQKHKDVSRYNALLLEKNDALEQELVSFTQVSMIAKYEKKCNEKTLECDLVQSQLDTLREKYKQLQRENVVLNNKLEKAPVTEKIVEPQYEPSGVPTPSVSFVSSASPPSKLSSFIASFPPDHLQCIEKKTQVTTEPLVDETAVVAKVDNAPQIKTTKLLSEESQTQTTPQLQRVVDDTQVANEMKDENTSQDNASSIKPHSIRVDEYTHSEKSIEKQTRIQQAPSIGKDSTHETTSIPNVDPSENHIESVEKKKQINSERQQECRNHSPQEMSFEDSTFRTPDENTSNGDNTNKTPNTPHNASEDNLDTRTCTTESMNVSATVREDVIRVVEHNDNQSTDTQPTRIEPSTQCVSYTVKRLKRPKVDTEKQKYLFGSDKKLYVYIDDKTAGEEIGQQIEKNGRRMFKFYKHG